MVGSGTRDYAAYGLVERNARGERYIVLSQTKTMSLYTCRLFSDRERPNRLHS